MDTPHTDHATSDVASTNQAYEEPQDSPKEQSQDELPQDRPASDAPAPDAPAPEVPETAEDEIDPSIPRRDLTSDEATIPMPEATQPSPVLADATEPVASAGKRRNAADTAAPRMQVGDTPSLGDIGQALVAWLRGRTQAVGQLLAGHRLVAGLAALACVALVLVAVLHGIRSSKMPSDDQIREDALTLLKAPSHTTGAFDTDDPMPLQEVEVVSKHSSPSRSDGCVIDVMATFASSDIETRADAQLDYVREGDTWTCTAATIGSSSHRALAAVREQLARDGMEELLQAAEDPDDDRTSLAKLYRDATVQVTDSIFDEEAQTCRYVLHLESGGTFVAYECDLTADFRFAAASGAWELAQSHVSKGAKDLGLHPLVGTWQGTFASQDADGGKCLASRGAGLTVTITQAETTDDGGAAVKGTVSGVAHLHAPIGADADATEGDLALDNAPFSGSISSGDIDLDVIDLLAGNQPKRQDAGLVFDCTIQDMSGGSVALTLTFGLASDPGAATATLASTHPYEETFLLIIPYQAEARFVDYFSLEKQ